MVYSCLSWVDHCVRLRRTCGTSATVVAGYDTGLAGMAAAEDLDSFDVGGGESLGAFVVEIYQAFRTHCSRSRSLDHKHTDPVVVSMLETVQIYRWQGKDQGESEQHSCLNAAADSVLNAAD